MPNVKEQRWNRPTWLGFLFALGAVLSNVTFFVNPPAQQVIPWLSLLLALVAVLFVTMGLWRIFAAPRVYPGRILNSILSVFSLLLVGAAIFTFIHARELPRSAGAPKVGQKAPEFTLADTSGHPVSLGQLFGPGSPDGPPRAVLLIFYRGYW